MVVGKRIACWAKSRVGLIGGCWAIKVWRLENGYSVSAVSERLIHEHADCSWMVDKAGDAIDEWDGSPWEVGRSAFRSQRNGNGLTVGDTEELPFSPWRL